MPTGLVKPEIKADKFDKNDKGDGTFRNITRKQTSSTDIPLLKTKLNLGNSTKSKQK